MPVITLPHARTQENGPLNAVALATQIRDALNPPIYVGPADAGDESCTMCGRTPPSGKLYKIIVDVVNDWFVLIGIDICRGEHLAKALNDLLATERMGTHRHKAARIRRLEDALAAIDR